MKLTHCSNYNSKEVTKYAPFELAISKSVEKAKEDKNRWIGLIKLSTQNI